VDAFERINDAVCALRTRGVDGIETAIVLGSGLGDVAEATTGATVVDYREIPHWPASATPGHAGKLAVRWVSGRRVVMLSGRAHFYEGHDLSTVVFATRVLGRLGVTQLVLTNAAGGITEKLANVSLMIIDDHINLLGANPLRGPNDERLGPRFPDMSEVYSLRLRRIADLAAQRQGVPVAHGVYAALPGPSYETPAEIRYLRTIGADAVGMSTVPEAIVARHLGLEVLGISCITNMAAGSDPAPVRHVDVLEAAGRVRPTLARLLEGIVDGL
jgi:purine-nucleoside phosphorylase